MIHKLGPTANALSTDKTFDATETSTVPGAAQTGNSIPSTDQMKQLTDKINELTDTTPPPMMRSPEVANPTHTNSIAYELQKDGMSSGQSLNQATQAGRSSPLMKQGGIVKADKGGGFSMIGTSIDNPIDAANGGALAALGDYNNSVMMKEGGKVDKGIIKKPKDEPPPGALPEEIADDQPTMLSKGEMVIPANVVRWWGLKFFTDMRDMALVGLARMDMAGQLRKDGDGKNPGEENEAPDMTLSGGRDAYEEAKGGENINTTVVSPYLKKGGIIKKPGEKDLTYNSKNVNFDQHDDEDDFMAQGGLKAGNIPPSNTNSQLPQIMPTAYKQSSPLFRKE